MSLEEIVERVTLSAGQGAGAQRPGRQPRNPACRPTSTVFHIEDGEFQMANPVHQSTDGGDDAVVRSWHSRDGIRFDCDLSSCQDEKNWLMQVVEDRIPSAADDLSELQLEFLAALAAALRRIDWDLPSPQLDLAKATELQDVFHGVRRQHRVALADALRAVYKCFLDRPFMMQIGLFIIRLDRAFALCRLEEVAGRAPARTRRVVA